MFRPLDTDSRVLGFLLGVGDLNRGDPCHGYANGCVCSGCVERDQPPLTAPERVRQPWELDAA